MFLQIIFFERSPILILFVLRKLLFSISWAFNRLASFKNQANLLLVFLLQKGLLKDMVDFSSKFYFSRLILQRFDDDLCFASGDPVRQTPSEPLEQKRGEATSGTN